MQAIDDAGDAWHRGAVHPSTPYPEERKVYRIYTHSLPLPTLATIERKKPGLTQPCAPRLRACLGYSVSA